MGSTPEVPEGCINTDTAAAMLGLKTASIRFMVRKGTLQPVRPPKGKDIFFRLTEVAALVDLRSQKMDLSGVAIMAMRALVLSRANEKRLQQIASLLGLDVPSLGTTEAEVIALYIEAQDLLKDPLELSADEVRRWARIFYAIDEAYLALVAKYSGTDEPWTPFLALAQSLSEGAPRRVFSYNKDLESAYAYLEAGRRNLRSVIYFHLRTMRGRRAADDACLEMHDSVDAQMLGLLLQKQL